MARRKLLAVVVSLSSSVLLFTLKKETGLFRWPQSTHLSYSRCTVLSGFVKSLGVGYFARTLSLWSKRVGIREVSGCVKASTFSNQIIFVSLDCQGKTTPEGAHTSVCSFQTTRANAEERGRARKARQMHILKKQSGNRA